METYPSWLASTANLFPSAHCQGIVVLSSVIGVEKLLEPLQSRYLQVTKLFNHEIVQRQSTGLCKKYLQKFKIVLEFSLHKPVHWNNLVDRHLLESRLKDLEVVDVLVLLLRVELHLNVVIRQ